MTGLYGSRRMEEELHLHGDCLQLNKQGRLRLEEEQYLHGAVVQSMG